MKIFTKFTGLKNRAAVVVLLALLTVSFSGLVMPDTMATTALAQDGPGLTDSFQILNDIANKIGLRTFNDVTGPGVVEARGANAITGFLLQLIRILQYALGIIAVIMLTYTSMRLISAGDKSDEVYGNAKKQFTYLFIGLLLVFVLDIIFTRVFVLGQTSFLDDAATAQQFAQIGSAELRGIYNLFQTFLGAAAVMMIVFHGVRLVTNAGTDEVTENAKRNITWGVAGLVLVAVSEFVVKGILFVDAGERISLENAGQLIVSLTNFVSGFVATAAIIVLMYAGYLYIFSGAGQDNSEKVKQAVTGAIIGLLLAAAAFGVVNTVITFQDAPETEVAEGVIN